MKNDSQNAQTFSVLSIFVLLHHYECSGVKSMAFSSKLGSHRKTGPIGKVVLGRWFCLLFGDSFGIYETKSALKYLAGRKKRDGYEKRELSHYKPGEFTRNLRKNAKGGGDGGQGSFGF